MEIGNTNIPTNDETTTEVIMPFVFDASYKGDALTKRCAEIIGMKDLTGWSVIDTFENLALVHYNPKTDFQKFGRIRGLLLDTESGDIIADSFGYTPIAVYDEITPIDDVVSITDTDGVNHKFLLTDKDVYVKRVFEGVVIRVIWYNNKMYRITHKKIIPTRSKWGNSKRFLNIYDEANGPTAEQLFDTTKPYSSTCYHFLAVDGTLLVATRQKVLAPYLVYIERQEICLQKPEEDVAIGDPTFSMIEKISGTVSISGIYNPAELNINNVNRFLKSGYYAYKEFNFDERQLTGESVIFYRKVGELIVDVVKVNSKSYEWRSNLRGGNHNIVNQFYAKLNSVYGDIKEDSQWEKFKSNLILFPLYSPDLMKNEYYKRDYLKDDEDEERKKENRKNEGILILGIEEGYELNRELYNTKQARIHLFWMNYVLALPISHQETALDLLDNFITDRDNLVKWLCTLEENVKKVEEPEYCKYIVRIIYSARKEGNKAVKDGTNLTRKGQVLNYKAMVKRKIYDLINNERGTSLYAMTREMKHPNLPKKI
jgi:hypothetical protein